MCHTRLTLTLDSILVGIRCVCHAEHTRSMNREIHDHYRPRIRSQSFPAISFGKISPPMRSGRIIPIWATIELLPAGMGRGIRRLLGLELSNCTYLRRHPNSSPLCAEGCLDATRIASFRSFGSMRKKLPIRSLLSMKSPSATTGFPLNARTVVTSHDRAS